ncbi:hypothetical protein L1987_00126 [Smallanthus sonchifolius]|uniref:Uncharacterized protein n=1 Tax=Smallanthus sonchifolius TaxID=185202 RepID=A0ACB9K1M9_9ASTR|nr:hypothetical protein L1987_00126 [Smallanthus sonchifolius]
MRERNDMLIDPTKGRFCGTRALSDLAGGGEDDSNEVDTFITLASKNAVKVAMEFIKLIGSLDRIASVVSN